MSNNFQRRDFLTGAAAIAAGMTAALVGTRRVEAGDPSFMNNVPDPLVAGKELPTFKFALEKSKGKVIGNSFGTAAPATGRPTRGWNSPPRTHKYRLLADPPRVSNKGGRLWLVDSTKFPIS